MKANRKSKCGDFLRGSLTDANPPFPSLPLLCRDTFLRSLAVTQWEKKRRSKHLSQAKHSSPDDVITPSQQPAKEEEPAGWRELEKLVRDGSQVER